MFRILTSVVESALAGENPLEALVDEFQGAPAEDKLKQRPSLGKLTELVVPEVKAHWEALAYSMGYEITQIVAIERNGRDEGERCTKLFRDWLSGSRGINSLRNGGQTWEELIVKIRNVDELNAAAERIQNKLLGSK